MIHVPPQVRGLIFDCDGTLADTMPTHWKAWHETFAAYGKTCPQAFLEKCMGIPSVRIVSLYNAAYGEKLDPQRFSAEKDRRSQEGLAYVGPIVPVVDVVRRYRGRLPMAVASGGIRKNVDMALEAIGLQGYFETILTADDDVPPKPSPAIFIEAARRLGVDPADCQVFEDGDAGLEAARQAGMIATDIRPFLK
jgi:beta-phosphoglucomutase-like phosphatase (HAD superfamily)